MIKILFDGMEVNDDLYTNLKNTYELFSDKFELGSVASNTFNLSVAKSINSDKPNLITIKENDNEIAHLYPDEIIENVSSYEFVLYDAMINLEKSYDASELLENSASGSVTLLEIAEDICSKFNLKLGTTDFNGFDKLISWYDNTLNARTYISYIAELNSGYATIENNTLYFLKHKKDSVKTIDVDECESFDLGEKHLITKVIYDNGIIKWEYGNDIGNTLYLNADNVYITERQDVEKIYNDIKDFEFYSLKTTNCPIDSNVKAGDIITFYDGLNYYPTIANYSISYFGGWTGYYSLNVKTGKQEDTEIIGTETKIKNIKSAINRQEAKLTILAQEMDENTEKIAEFEITVDGVSTTIENQNNQISEVTQTVEELNSKIKDIADITISGESDYALLELDNINQSEPIRVVVRPIGEHISYLYPHSNLFPSDTLYLKNRKVRFKNKTTGEIFDYELPNDLLYHDSNNYDEFILDYDGQSCVVNKKVAYNADGTTSILENPTTISYSFPKIELTDGDYEISLLGYNNAYIFVRLMAQNIYTTQFATRAELNSEITQTANEINLEVSKKVGNNEVISKINQSAESVNIKANKININGVITAINNDTSTTINGDKITTGSITSKEIAANAITADKVSSDIITTTNFSAQEIDADNITTGTLSADRVRGGTLMGANFKGDTDNSSYFTIGTNDLSDAPSNGFINLIDSSNILRLSLGTRFKDTNLEQLSIYSPNARFFNFLTEKADSRVGANAFVADSFMYSPAYNGGSLESIKKNIELYDKDCLDIIKKADIYSYNLKNENNNCKKHIGLIIGDLGGNYNTPTEIINNENNGIDLYSMISVSWKAIKEQEVKYQKEINQLKEEIKQLKESDK